MIDERTLKVSRCAYLSHEMKLTNTEIAKIIKEPRAKIPALLREAEELGIIRIEFNFPQDTELERNLIKQFHLRDARVVARVHERDESQRSGNSSEDGKATNDEDPTIEHVGKTAADYFERTTPDDSLKVGFSGGRTLRKVADHLHEDRFKNLGIYPLAVSMMEEAIATHTTTIVGIVDGKYKKCSSYPLPLPPLMVRSGDVEDIKKEKAAILKNTGVDEIYYTIKEIDVGLIGISNIREGKGISWMFRDLAKRGLVEQDLLDRLIDEYGFVGEILYQPFRSDGEIPPEAKKLISPVLERAFLPIRLDDLKKRVEAGKRVLLIGSGDSKAEAIAGALRAGYANILITDDQTAKKVLSFAQSQVDESVA